MIARNVIRTKEHGPSQDAKIANLDAERWSLTERSGRVVSNGFKVVVLTYLKYWDI